MEVTNPRVWRRGHERRRGWRGPKHASRRCDAPCLRGSATHKTMGNQMVGVGWSSAGGFRLRGAPAVFTEQCDPSYAGGPQLSSLVGESVWISPGAARSRRGNRRLASRRARRLRFRGAGLPGVDLGGARSGPEVRRFPLPCSGVLGVGYATRPKIGRRRRDLSTGRTLECWVRPIVGRRQ